MMDLSLDTHRRLIKEIETKKLSYIQFNGNYGDFAAAANALDTVYLWREAGVQKILFNTNGSLQSPNWWTQMAQALGPNGLVVFSIDGLEDSNSIYRIGSNWNRIMQNSDAFIAAGGHARWDFILFEHNQHQVDQAIELAERKGFQSIRIKKTNRFLKDHEIRNWKKDLHSASRILKGQFDTAFDHLSQKYHDVSEFIENEPIQCEYQKLGGGVFVDFQSRVWPCCWTATGEFLLPETIQRQQIQKIYSLYGEHFNSLLHHSLSEILHGDWFQHDLVASWAQKPAGGSPKLWACAKTCGSYKFSSGDRANFHQINFK
ncbi:MAG: hypothetical protein ACK5Y2_11235 [Bdellovibrionales bacterium]